MTDAQLGIVIARTGHERYRWLTREDNPDVAQRDGYRALVAGMADDVPAAQAVEPPTPPSPVLAPLSEALRASNLGGRNCPHGSAPKTCNCSSLSACSLLGRDVRLDDCISCLATGPRSHEVAPAT